MKYILPLFAAVALLGAAPVWNPQLLAGTWKCTNTVSNQKGTVTYTQTAMAFGRWTKFTGTYPAAHGQPADSFESLLSYDSRAHRWIFINFGSQGDYGIGKSTSAPTALTQTWVDAYPVDPNDGPTTVSMSSQKFTFEGSSMMKGKKVTSRGVCVKQ